MVISLRILCFQHHLDSSLPPVGSCLIYAMCVWVRFSGVGHVLSCVFLRIVFPLLPVSLDCPFLIAVRYSLTFISIILLLLRGGQLYWL